MMKEEEVFTFEEAQEAVEKLLTKFLKHNGRISLKDVPRFEIDYVIHLLRFCKLGKPYP